MPTWRNYSLRILGAAGDLDDHAAPLHAAAKEVGSRFFTARVDDGDLLVNAVFAASDQGEHLLREAATRALPSSPHERIVVRDEPDPPHEISAQLLDDKRNGRSVLPGALQSPEDLKAWDDFLAQVRPRGLIELGTASGVFSRWLNKRVRWFKTIDVGTPPKRVPGFLRIDLWTEVDAVRDLIARAPRPFVLYCDNGDKPREVRTFASALRAGDFLAVHDFGTEIFSHDIPPDFTERLMFGLTAFYART